jgi:multidrug efflux pump subunit AcrA (membrane-fusion protein)
MNKKYLLLLFFSAFFSCKQKQETYTVNEQTINEAVYASGEIEPAEFYEVLSAVPYRILKAFVQQGDKVAKGQLLAVLGNPSDEDELASVNQTLAIAQENSGKNSAQLKGMKTQINAAKNKLDVSQNDADRYTKLAKPGAVSGKEAEQYRLTAENAQSEYENLQQQYNALKNELETSLLVSQQAKSQVLQRLQDKHLLSPANGFVLSENYKEGEMLPANEALFTVGNNKNYILKLLVDERDISKIKQGQKVVFETDAYPDKQFEATIFILNPVVQNKTKSVEVRAKVAASESFYPKASVEANIIIRSNAKSIAIPADYLVGKDSVYLRKDKKTAEKIKIVRGIQNNNWIEITGGLKTGDVIEKGK